MVRDTLGRLVAWKNRPTRKPLLVRGARQVGKTFLIKEFAQREYSQCAYLNFEQNPALGGLFDGDIDPRKLVGSISAYLGMSISAQTTLLFLDEIQSCPRALTSLKYFFEQAPEYHVVAAGSLLGVAVGKATSFPVGKVELLNMYPLSFLEFVGAMGEQRLGELLRANVCLSPSRSCSTTGSANSFGPTWLSAACPKRSRVTCRRETWRLCVAYRLRCSRRTNGISRSTQPPRRLYAWRRSGAVCRHNWRERTRSSSTVTLAGVAELGSLSRRCSGCAAQDWSTSRHVLPRHTFLRRRNLPRPMRGHSPWLTGSHLQPGMSSGAASHGMARLSDTRSETPRPAVPMSTPVVKHWPGLLLPDRS